MNTTYIVVGLVVLVAIVAVVYVLSQPRGAQPQTFGTMTQGNTSAQSIFNGLWSGGGQIGSTIAGATS